MGNSLYTINVVTKLMKKVYMKMMNFKENILNIILKEKFKKQNIFYKVKYMEDKFIILKMAIYNMKVYIKMAKKMESSLIIKIMVKKFQYANLKMDLHFKDKKFYTEVV